MGLSWRPTNARSWHWFLVYVAFPITFVLGEFVLRVLIGWAKIGPYDAFPYVSLMVCLITVAIFTRDEISEYQILDPDGDEIDEKQGHKAAVMMYIVAMTIIYAASILFEGLVHIRNVSDMGVPLAICRAFSVIVAAAFVRNILVVQKRFKLRAN